MQGSTEYPLFALLHLSKIDKELDESKDFKVGCVQFVNCLANLCSRFNFFIYS